MFTSIEHRSPSFPKMQNAGLLSTLLSACELLGIDAFMEDDLGYAPS